MTSPPASVDQTSGPDFLSNQGADDPVMTVALQKKVMGGRNFRGEPGPENPPVAETVLLSILGGEEMDWCVERLGDIEDAQILEGRPNIVTLPLGDGQISVVGPCVYAPLVGGAFENLAHNGVKRVVALGWCGAIHPDVRIGDILLASSVVREEGTSYHYLPADANPLPSPTVSAALRGAASKAGIVPREGPIWTTDAPYRETPYKVKEFGDRGVLGVDMETSAIVSLGSALGIEVGVLLLISDELWGEEWRWGVPTGEFATARQRYVQIAADAALALTHDS